MIPVETAEDLLNWQCLTDNSLYCCDINISENKLQKESGLPIIIENETSQRNKVLYCHDFCDGYLDDALIHGNDNVYAFRFYHWHLIDIFVYFTHHFVTIPPKGWIYQAHKNGVQCLGTLIIEPGSHNDNFLKLFESDNYKVAAHKLNEIRKFYNFEGWLINVECEVKNPLAKTVIDNICEFLNCLTKAGSEVVWYDAITVSGSLSWQNCLNNENRKFYDNCGKIFTNYCWNKNCLETSLLTSNGRGDTVFIGIDCFGRGCPGGGGFNCNVALEMIEEVCSSNQWKDNSNLSIALFAPGWCHETVSIDAQEKDLDLNIWHFYDLISHFLKPCLNGEKVYRQLPDIFIDKNTSFTTNFDIGQGYSFNIEGAPISYNNLLKQEITPSGSFYPRVKDVAIKLLPCREFAFSGYSCFKIVVDIGENNSFQDFPIHIEFFRLGCHFEKDINLKLSFGQKKEGLIDEIWNGLRMKFSFSLGDSRIKEIEYELGEIIKRKSEINNATIEWTHYKFDNICSKLEGDEDGGAAVLRKVEMIVKDKDTLHCLEKSCLYLGQFTFESAL